MPEQKAFTILRMDGSARCEHSVTRQPGDVVMCRLLQEHPSARITVPDLAGPGDFIDEHRIRDKLAEPATRDAAQRALLADSHHLLQQLDAADIVVLTAPVYNFPVPAALKAWIDMVCRARLSFRYTDHGALGLLRERTVYLVMASGGSPDDFASGYLRHILAFIGIRDVRMVRAESTGIDAGSGKQAALDMLDHWLPDMTAPLSA